MRAVNEVIDKETKSRGNHLERAEVRQRVVRAVIEHSFFQIRQKSVSSKEREAMVDSAKETNGFLSKPANVASTMGWQARRALVGGMAGDRVTFSGMKRAMGDNLSEEFFTDCKRRRRDALSSGDPGLL